MLDTVATGEPLASIPVLLPGELLDLTETEMVGAYFGALGWSIWLYEMVTAKLMLDIL